MVCSSRYWHHSVRIWRYQDGLRWSAAGINLLEWSPQPAVRRVMVLSAPGYTLLCCCFLSGLYTR
ncbi:hypothetical protein F1L18_07030 [Escherichia coli]|nr:hypothetical protein F1L18_07030 [Escherichia coli]